MTDVLYVLGKESQYNNLELRLSLRSLEEYANNLGKVYIAGEKPDWIKNVRHIKTNDIYTKEMNIFGAVLEACKSDISENFLYMNDDFFMMEEFDVDFYPYFTDCEMRYIDNPSRYQEIQNKTLNDLYKRGINCVDSFECHCPMIFNKTIFKSFRKFFDEHKNDRVGYFFRTLYGNVFIPKYDRIISPDCKLWGADEIHDTYQRCISTKDDCEDILYYLLKEFPKKSKYEKKD